MSGRKGEIYSLTSQIRRSSRSVAANLAEAYRKRRYEKSFTAKLSDAEGEAAETQTWLDMARDFEYISPDLCKEMNEKYNHVLGKIVTMLNHPEKWSF